MCVDCDETWSISIVYIYIFASENNNTIEKHEEVRHEYLLSEIQPMKWVYMDVGFWMDVARQHKNGEPSMQHHINGKELLLTSWIERAKEGRLMKRTFRNIHFPLYYCTEREKRNVWNVLKVSFSWSRKRSLFTKKQIETKKPKEYFHGMRISTSINNHLSLS